MKTSLNKIKKFFTKYYVIFVSYIIYIPILILKKIVEHLLKVKQGDLHQLQFIFNNLPYQKRCEVDHKGIMEKAKKERLEWLQKHESDNL